MGHVETGVKTFAAFGLEYHCQLVAVVVTARRGDKSHLSAWLLGRCVASVPGMSFLTSALGRYLKPYIVCGRGNI